MNRFVRFASIAALLTLTSNSALARRSPRKVSLRVMTYNVDEGSDFRQVTRATTPAQFLVAVGKTITHVRATHPPARMIAVARQIVAAHPTLVSLQEVDQWSTGSFNPATQTCGPVTIKYDMLRELMGALAAQGAHYQVAVKATEIAFPPTPGLILPRDYLCVAVRDYNVILARTDLAPSQFSWANPHSGEFKNILTLPTPVGKTPVRRVWSSVDVTFKKKKFRFINSHLESFNASVRKLQAGELRAGPANTPLPVIIAMDSNAQAAPLRDPAYSDFIAAGYKDVWQELKPAAQGFTCCQAEFVNNSASELRERIDLILTHGNIKAQNIALFGATVASKTPEGLWPSDHAGVAAQLEIGK